MVIQSVDKERIRGSTNYSTEPTIFRTFIPSSADSSRAFRCQQGYGPNPDTSWRGNYSSWQVLFVVENISFIDAACEGVVLDIITNNS